MKTHKKRKTYKYGVDIYDAERGYAGLPLTVLKKKGFSVSYGHSPYVGSVAIHLRYNTMDDIKRALRELKKHGIVSSVEYQYKRIRQNLNWGLY